MPKNLDQWLQYIENVHSRRIDMTLDRVREVAKRLNVLQFNCPVVTVAGTNGKGSTVALLGSLWRAGGYRVGAFTSPHLLRYNERIMLDQTQANDAEICTAFEEIEHQRGDIALTYFEFGALAALYLFKQSSLDAIILEVGLGGRLDATNIIDADVSVITSIDIDHTSWLGNTCDAIGAEKAGIMRSNQQVVCGPNMPGSVLTRAQELNVNLHRVGDEFSYQLTDQTWCWQSNTKVMPELPQTSLHADNAAVAIMVSELVELPLSLPAVVQGLALVSLPGRCQLISMAPKQVLDVAHNVHSVQHLNRWLEQHCRGEFAHIVFSALADKELSKMIAELQVPVKNWYISTLETSRAADLSTLMEALQHAGVSEFTAYTSLENAYNDALNAVKNDEYVLVFGSFYTVALIMQLRE